MRVLNYYVAFFAIVCLLVGSALLARDLEAEANADSLRIGIEKTAEIDSALANKALLFNIDIEQYNTIRLLSWTVLLSAKTIAEFEAEIESRCNIKMDYSSLELCTRLVRRKQDVAVSMQRQIRNLRSGLPRVNIELEERFMRVLGTSNMLSRSSLYDVRFSRNDRNQYIQQCNLIPIESRPAELIDCSLVKLTPYSLAAISSLAAAK